MRAKTIMIQGTGSSVGKSILVAALCRIFKQDGLAVAPYKSQNMSLNSFVTRDGGEMGRAQVVQAEAAGIEPSVDMNPILLKPEADTRSQVVVLGKPTMTIPAGEYYLHTPELLSIARESLNRIRANYDLVIIEGAGSPAEINLKHSEIVNMRIAKMAQAPVLLVGDIDKGGVFASLVGTLALLDQEEQAYIRGFIINKFRGDISLLKPGLDQLEELTSLPVIGVVPYYHDIFIDEEDSVRYQGHSSVSSDIDVAVIYLPHISNSTDFEPLQQEDGVRVRYVRRLEELGNPDAIIVPGSKSTVSDLSQIRETGLANGIVQQAQSGIPVVGICGGFQMLGMRIDDPEHAESEQDSVQGLGLLDIVTAFKSDKTTWQVRAQTLVRDGIFANMGNEEIIGYEIHMGQTRLGDHASPAFRIIQRGTQPIDHFDGAMTDSGTIVGTYIHGLFDNSCVRHAFLANIQQRNGIRIAMRQTMAPKNEQYDRLAEHVRSSINLDLIREICNIRYDRRKTGR